MVRDANNPESYLTDVESAALNSAQNIFDAAYANAAVTYTDKYDERSSEKVRQIAVACTLAAATILGGQQRRR